MYLNWDVIVPVARLLSWFFPTQCQRPHIRSSKNTSSSFWMSHRVDSTAPGWGSIWTCESQATEAEQATIIPTPPGQPPDQRLWEAGSEGNSTLAPGHIFHWFAGSWEHSLPIPGAIPELVSHRDSWSHTACSQAWLCSFLFVWPWANCFPFWASVFMGGEWDWQKYPLQSYGEMKRVD